MHRPPRRLIAAALTLAATGAVAPAAGATAFDLEAHRGGRGLQPENTLAAFGDALRRGVSTLELDTGVTKDGFVVVSHERRISTLECRDTAPARAGDAAYPYVGKLVKELTLRQLRTLDCGTRTPANPATDPFLATQRAVPGTRMPTLAEVFALARRYGAGDVQFNIETKLDPTAPGDTVAPATFARKVVTQIRRARVTQRAMVQSFDWRTLKVVRREAPSLRVVALAQPATIFPGTRWTAGIAIRSTTPFDDGTLARAVRQGLKAHTLSPVATATTRRLVRDAHRFGLRVVPWTVNEKTDMEALIDLEVDGLITDYPDRLREVLDAKGIALPDPIASPFDVQAHRGGKAKRPENTLAAFRYALSLDVTTLELDTGVTKDGVLVVTHDQTINPKYCTGGFAGVPVRELTLAQIKTLDCGNVDPAFPGQVAQPGERMPTLQEVFDFVAASGDEDVRLNIETKLSPTIANTAPYDVFAAKLVKAIRDNDLQDRATIQSFDWRTIRLAKRLDASIDTVALVWQYAGADCDDVADECSLEAVAGDPTVASPWTGGLDWWDFRDLGALVHAADADVVSSNWQVHDPNLGHVESADWYLKESPSIYHGPTVAELHDRGLKVIPYTIDDEATMQRVIDLQVDGIISDDPALLQRVAARNGLS